jgi:hypothetical protein
MVPSAAASTRTTLALVCLALTWVQRSLAAPVATAAWAQHMVRGAASSVLPKVEHSLLRVLSTRLVLQCMLNDTVPQLAGSSIFCSYAVVCDCSYAVVCGCSYAVVCDC